nr:MAG TPA: hypothetical protein [Caudoviricetes sp.]
MKEIALLPLIKYISFQKNQLFYNSLYLHSLMKVIA